jgi:hypothetical protein
LQTLAYNTGPGGNQFPQATLATLVSEGAPVRPVDMPTTVGAFEDLGNATLAAQRTIVFSETDNPDAYFINGRLFAPGSRLAGRCEHSRQRADRHPDPLPQLHR